MNKYFKPAKKVNFDCKLYNDVQNLCFDLFGPQCVRPDLKFYCIYIHKRINLKIAFSSNETKVYIYTYIDPFNLIPDTEETFYFKQMQSGFLLASYEAIKDYLNLKIKEIEFIREREF